MKNLFSQIEVIDFYFSKIEIYMSHKHRNLLNRIGGGNSELESYESGSPKSTLSDR